MRPRRRGQAHPSLVTDNMHAIVRHEDHVRLHDERIGLVEHDVDGRHDDYAEPSGTNMLV